MALLIIMVAFSAIVTHLNWFFTSLILGFLIVILIINLIRYIFSFKNNLDNLIHTYEESNFQSKLRITRNKSKLKEVDQAFERIHNVVQTARVALNAQSYFLKTLIENIPSGVITLNQENNIININQSAKQILGLADDVNWSKIKETHPNLANQVELNNYLSNELISPSVDDELKQLSYSISTMKLQQDEIKIISFQNIKTVLDRNEMQAWNNLIRTMTHEIMNSVTPIISLSESGLNIISNKADLHFTEKNIEHLFKSFSSIYNKSQWLKTFVEDYRKLIRIPHPEKREVNLPNLVNSCITEFEETINNKKIDLELNLSDIVTNIDPNLIGQVLVNLLKNSIEALPNSEGKFIRIFIGTEKGNPIIKITDNGSGISSEAKSKIFIPFFSTKPSGSGIGLSLSRQIMRLHNGDITFESNPGNETTFILHFG